MRLVLVSALLALVAATYVSAVAIALMRVSRSALERRLVAKGRERRGVWLFEHIESTRLAVGLVRTTLRVLVLTLMIVEFGDPDGNMTTGGLVGAAVVSIFALWAGTAVLATALARYSGEALVSGALPMLRVLAAACWPLTRGVAFVDESVRRLSGANLKERDGEIEAELLRSIDDTHREGGLDEKSATLLENVVEFSSTDVGEVMTPRTDIDGIELSDDLAAIRAFIVEVGHSRIPVFEDNLDHIVGVLYVKDLVPYLGQDGSGFKLRPLLRQPNVVPETKPVRELLADFQRSEVHMAMVIDEYGGTAGLVTIEDVLEEIVGEINDEHDPDDEEAPALITIDDCRAEVDGRYHIDDLNERLGLDLPEDEEFDTVAGFVLATLGHVPSEGETFEAYTARFTAIATTPTHVQRVAVELLEPAVSNGDRRKKTNGE